MTAPRTPSTAAGKALLARGHLFQCPYRMQAAGLPLLDSDECICAPTVAAIEAEAARAANDRAALLAEALDLAATIVASETTSWLLAVERWRALLADTPTSELAALRDVERAVRQLPLVQMRGFATTEGWPFGKLEHALAALDAARGGR